VVVVVIEAAVVLAVDVDEAAVVDVVADVVAMKKTCGSP
jgi:hypothetical protein